MSPAAKSTTGAARSIIYLGMDVHKESITTAVRAIDTSTQGTAEIEMTDKERRARCSLWPLVRADC